MDAELTVISDEGRPVPYIVKRDAVKKLDEAVRAKNNAINVSARDRQARKQSESRITSMRVLIERLLDNVVAVNGNWQMPLSDSELTELRNALALREDA